MEGLACASCGKPASLQCPKCLTLELPKEASAFCSQTCFKGAWGEHKKVHKKQDSDWQYACDRGRGRMKGMPSWSWTGTLRPYPISQMRKVPDTIPQPDWASTGFPAEEQQSRWQQSVPIRTPEEIEKMRAACLLGRKMLDLAHAHVKPGVTTDEIDRVVHEATVAAGAYPSPLNYHNFPKSCCTSVNEVVCHGIPDSRPLEDGDLVNVDISLLLDGNHADLNETFVVGEVDEDTKHLIKSTYECLEKSVAMCRPGVRFRDVGQTISKVAQNAGLSVVKSYCGHGIGELFHCAPNIPHYHPNKAVGLMKAGMIFTIEPMINQGVYRDRTWPDGWTAVTEDGKRSAQFEHTLLVTETGVEVLTARLPTSPKLFWEK